MNGNLLASTICDFDGDGIMYSLNIDLDNDDIVNSLPAAFGVYGLCDTVKVNGTQATNLTYKILDLATNRNYDTYQYDSDNDGCNDVLEAGFTEVSSNSGELRRTWD